MFESVWKECGNALLDVPDLEKLAELLIVNKKCPTYSSVIYCDINK